MTDTPYLVPKEPGRWRALTLAASVHIALLVFLWIGISWQNETPVAVEAELWNLQTRDAAPLPEPKPEPKPEPEPKPVVKEAPKAKPDEVPVPKVDIALEKEKKRKEQERKDKLAEQEHEDKLKKQKAEREKEKQEKQEKLAEQQKAEQQKKADADKKHKQEVADAALRDKVRADEMRRLTGAVGSGGSGEAVKSQGSGRADAGYADKIRAKIRSNTIFNVPPELSGNPAVEFDVELLPDGSLRALRLRKSSGLSGFDEAVKRAIERSQPFPPDKSGHVPDRFTVVHKPKDQ